jgi:alpha-L-rhamnosidase
LKIVISFPIWILICVAAASFLACEPLQAKVEAANAPSGLLCDLLEHPEETVITTAAPKFGWVYNPSFPNDAQTAYRIIVAKSKTTAVRGVGNIWDSGLVYRPSSINIPYAGRMLKANTDYFWRVQTVDSSGRPGPFSAVQHFRTDATLITQSDSIWRDPTGQPFIGLVYNASSNIWANRYPLHFVSATPVLVTNTAPGRWFIDFGQDAFGYATVHLKGPYNGREVQVKFGEMACGSAVDTFPPDGSMVRCTNVDLTLQNGNVIYPVRPPVYPVYNKKRAVNPPENFGTIMPFRYLELINCPGKLNFTDVVQERLLDEFNTNAAAFTSSSCALNQIWNLCRNSMQILSFDGIYIDGDRERTPYEADCYIHQLSAYAVDREFTTLRYSFEYLLQHPTWPTEWKFHMIFMAWADYLQTGNTNLIFRYYDALKPDLFTWAVTGNGLMKGFPNFPQSTNSDVIDWPPEDRDGFVIKDRHYLNWTNSVNNAFYYRSLQIMAKIATVTGHEDDATNYTSLAARVYQSYNATFWNSNSQSYVDGVGTTHSSAHANFFPLAFGLVPADRRAAVVHYLHSRIAAHNGMPASVYGAQYLLEALFQSGDTDTALDLMTTNGPRGWLNMINMGSTLTTEAWNFGDKTNMDWNHPWGAAPGNLISRYVLGVRPLTPGYGQILIQPQLGSTLSYVRGTVPTIRGPVTIQATRTASSFSLVADIPGNVMATVLLPATETTNVIVRLDGDIISGTPTNNWLAIRNIGSGKHAISLSANDAPMTAANGH